MRWLWLLAGLVGLVTWQDRPARAGAAPVVRRGEGPAGPVPAGADVPGPGHAPVHRGRGHEGTARRTASGPFRAPLRQPGRGPGDPAHGTLGAAPGRAIPGA